VLGQTRLQFQEAIAPPRQRPRPSAGLLQPFTLLVVVAIVAFELGLLAFLVDWRDRILPPEVEAADFARAEEIRALKLNAQTGTVSATRPASVVALPGTSSAAPASTNAADATPIADDIRDVLDEADFDPADTNASLVDLPPISAADPAIEKAQHDLAQAVAAAQFADYPQAFRLLNQIHLDAPGFLPAYAEHARLLEARGDLDGAHRRWTQILGLAPDDSPFRAQALEQRERLVRLQTLQIQILQSPRPVDPDSLPRAVRIANPEIQKMPADPDVAEMRVLNATLEIAADDNDFQNTPVQVFLTFYDTDPDNQIRPTRAITTPSPLVLGHAFASRRSAPLQATYVVPRGLRAQTQGDPGRQASYYGYTLHVFAGHILQDAAAKPKKLLALPIHFPGADSNAPPLD
ncbi:MAG TPA: hypothetical protein DCM68_03870, partial [Verrucomicrobia bacterium]|nr:hypothetical protein [Verrucomicrobiota bacterium]